MDYVTSASIIGGTVAIGASLGVLWYMAKRAPVGYEDADGFHYGEPPAPLEMPPFINWDRPLELLDGTPVRLDTEGFCGGPNPDKDGDFWVVREDGGAIIGTDGDVYRSACVHPNGCEEGTETPMVRNRAALVDTTLLEVPAEHVPPPTAANTNVPALTDDQRTVLLEMSEEIGLTAATLRERTGLPHARVTEARRQLADKGLAVLTTLRSEDDGMMAGRGYILTPEGVAARNTLLDEREAAA